MSEPNQDLVKRMQGDECFLCHQIGHWSRYCPLKSPNNKPDLVKRMQGEECFLCHQIGHWSWYCPLKSPNNKPDLVKRMQGEECFLCHQIGHWSWYCPLKSPNNKPDLVKRMQGEECFLCHQIGHWSWYCPSKSPNNNKNKSLSPSSPSTNNSSLKMIRCRCGHGFCDIKTSFTNSKYYTCPIKRGAKCKDFVKCCNDPIDESDLQPPQLKYPECACGAGVCRSVKGTSENPNAVKYYFVCPVKKDHGSCGYQVSEDELLNNKSIVPIRQSRQRSLHDFWEGSQNDKTDNDLGNELGEEGGLLVQTKRVKISDNSENSSSMAGSEIPEVEDGGSATKATNSKSVGFPGFGIADDDLEVANSVSREAIEERAVLLSSLSTRSRIHRRQSVFQRLIFADESLGIFPSFNPIVVPKQESIPNGHSESNNLASNSLSQHTQLSTVCHTEVSRDLLSPNKSPGNKNKPMSKAQRHREVALFTQQRLLIDLETWDPREHESMREAADTTFAVLNLLGVNFKQFSDHVMDFINIASSIAEMDKSMESSLTLEELNELFEEEKVRLAHIQDNYVKIEASLKISQQHRQSLCEQVSHLKAKLHEKENQLKSCELETLKIETHLGDLKQHVLEADITLRDRAEQAEIARKQREEKQAKQIAAKRALDMAKLELEN